jgi:hypothetical protein
VTEQTPLFWERASNPIKSGHLAQIITKQSQTSDSWMIGKLKNTLEIEKGQTCRFKAFPAIL